MLIPKIGIEGAAIATLIGYAVSDVICVLVLSKMKLHIISARFSCCSVLMAAYMIIWRLFGVDNMMLSLTISAAGCAIMACLYKNDIKKLLKGFRK